MNNDPIFLASEVTRLTAALEEECSINAGLRSALANGLQQEIMINEMVVNQAGLSIQAQGGAASLLAEMLAKQYKDANAINYVEMTFVSQVSVPGEQFVVDVRRFDGLSPHQLRAQAEKERDEWKAKFEVFFKKANF